MIARLTSLLPRGRRPPSAETLLQREWDRLVASAMSPQERDEINDIFGRAVAGEDPTGEGPPRHASAGDDPESEAAVEFGAAPPRRVEILDSEGAGHSRGHGLVRRRA